MPVVYLSQNATRQLLDAQRRLHSSDRILIGLVNKNSDDLTFHILTTLPCSDDKTNDDALLDVVLPCGLSSIGTYSSKCSSSSNALWIQSDGARFTATYQDDKVLPVIGNSELGSIYRFRCDLSLLSNQVSSLSNLISHGSFAVSSSSSSEWLWLGSTPSDKTTLQDWLGENASRLKTTTTSSTKVKKKKNKKSKKSNKKTTKVSTLQGSDFVSESSISNLYLLLDEDDDKVPTFYFDGTRVSNRSVRFNLSLLIYANPDELATRFVDKVRRALCLQLEQQHALVLESSKEVTSHHFTPPVRSVLEFQYQPHSLNTQ